jgi:hypothetical protein
VITEMLAPAVIVALLLIALGWESARYRPIGLLHGAIAGLFESVLPFAYIMRQVRAGRLSDHHIGVRQQRFGPLMVALASVLTGFVILVLLGSARQLIAGVVAGAVGLVVAAGVSHWWKMSIHTAVAAGAATILSQVFAPAPVVFCAASPLVVLVGWSRTRLRDHTVAQVVVGAIVGAAVAGSVFGLVR